MDSKALNPMDATWLYVESKNTPMNVGGLLIFELPDDAAPDFFQKLLASWKAQTIFYPPWNRKLRDTRLMRSSHAWVEDKHVDLDYHICLTALPWPGGEQELSELVERLHSRPLDMRRPPWECYVIQGLQGGRFALYLKIHHAMIDGVSGMRLMDHVLAKTGDSQEFPAFWAVPPQAPISGEVPALDSVRSATPRPGALLDLSEAARRLLQMAFSKDDPMGIPFKAPRSIFNERIGGQRRFAMKMFSLKRIKVLARAAKCSLNDLVLAICGAALRRFLLENEALPAQSLTACIPVSVRPKDDTEQGNAISFMIATLGTDITDPMDRLAAISASTRQAKRHLRGLPKSAIESYTMMLMGPFILQLLSGLGGRTRPMFNVTISNVPGPQQLLYLQGAKMVANYPVSLITHGQALNITCHGYADTLNFGFLGCRESVPRMQHIAAYTGEALDELEALLLRNRSARPSAELPVLAIS